METTVGSVEHTRHHLDTGEEVALSVGMWWCLWK